MAVYVGDRHGARKVSKPEFAVGVFGYVGGGGRGCAGAIGDGLSAKSASAASVAARFAGGAELRGKAVRHVRPEKKLVPGGMAEGCVQVDAGERGVAIATGRFREEGGGLGGGGKAKEGTVDGGVKRSEVVGVLGGGGDAKGESTAMPDGFRQDGVGW